MAKKATRKRNVAIFNFVIERGRGGRYDTFQDSRCQSVQNITSEAYLNIFFIKLRKYDIFLLSGEDNWCAAVRGLGVENQFPVVHRSPVWVRIKKIHIVAIFRAHRR